VIRVHELHVYPVKSLGGVSVPRAAVADRGFAHDRRFMVVDEANRFVTQRTLPRMSLVSLALGRDELRLTAPGMSELSLPLRPSGHDIRLVEVWRDRCEALFLGDGPARWLSDFLGTSCGLVYMPDTTLRRYDPAGGSGRVSFADASPFLLTSRSSLRELARRGADVPMDRFRANIVVDGAPPFAEDHWTRLRIGAVEFRVTAPCVRCSVTTVDPSTGAVAGPEPLRTLATFRGGDDGLLFGVNLVHESTGAVALGDPVVLRA
jgi:uncharacterized protein